MKKIKMLSIVSLISLALMGCQNTSDREAALEDQVAQLEQQVTSLEKEKEELSGSESVSNNKSPASSENVSLENASSENTSSENTSSESASNDDIDTLTKAVDDVVKKANDASASGSNDDNQKSFFKLKGNLHDVENRLERYEDRIEDSFRQGSLSYEEARNAELEIERLEEKLDNAEDRLEFVFGYDD